MEVKPDYLSLVFVGIIAFVGFVVFPILMWISAVKMGKIQKENPALYKKMVDEALPCSSYKCRGWFRRFREDHCGYPREEEED